MMLFCFEKSVNTRSCLPTAASADAYEVLGCSNPGPCLPSEFDQGIYRRFTMKVNKELMKGSTGMLILTLLDRKEMYGYEMTKEIENRSHGLFTFKEGTLYPILHALEAEKIVESYWSEQEGRKRKYYRITTDGRKYLQDKQQEWSLFRTAVDRVIGEGQG
jgi:PadR family transcriptional regulator PadR